LNLRFGKNEKGGGSRVDPVEEYAEERDDEKSELIELLIELLNEPKLLDSKELDIPEDDKELVKLDIDELKSMLLEATLPELMSLDSDDIELDFIEDLLGDAASDTEMLPRLLNPDVSIGLTFFTPNSFTSSLL
jgi:hypothetical protein